MDMEESDDRFVFQTMLTCIGNKRKLVHHIKDVAKSVATALGRTRINIVDGFAGSTVVSRGLCEVADRLYANDMELYSFLMAKCFLEAPCMDDQVRIQLHIDRMNQLAEHGPYTEGIICRLYAPRDTNRIQPGERCFYTRENALVIDTLRAYISESVESDLVPYCLAPLLTKASIHTNTAGVFKGFYKKGGIGWFGGKGENALSRIMKPIRLDMPLWSGHASSIRVQCTQRDINDLVQELPSDIDLIYLDPPYNQHPYGSNYFMLNIIAKNQEPTDLSKVSGIPKDWQKSAFNAKRTAMESMRRLIRDGLRKSKYILISYNNEGIIEPADWDGLFREAGCSVKKYEVKYDTFKGCRNLKSRSNKVVEVMYLIGSPTLPSPTNVG